MGRSPRHPETRRRRSADPADAGALGQPASNCCTDDRTRAQRDTRAQPDTCAQPDTGAGLDPLPGARARADSPVDPGTLTQTDADGRADGRADAHAPPDTATHP